VEGAGPVLILQRPDVRSDRRRSGRPGGPSTPTRRARLLASTAARFQVTDLDPGSGGVRRRGQGRRVLGEILDDRGIRSYPKTSGGAGPSRPGSASTRSHARDGSCVRAGCGRGDGGARSAAGDRHDGEGQASGARLRRCVAQRVRPDDRRPYSVRRRPRAPVSTPLDWDEVAARLDPAQYNLRTIERRVAGADPWADFWKRRQSLPAIS
jgi:bifunctional non-homologous end joining protein LigD